MTFDNDDDDDDEARFGLQEFQNLLKTDLIASARQLIEFVDGEIALDSCELTQVDYKDEGDGNYMFCVIEFKLDGQSLGFVRMGGTYSSWDSSEWDTDDLTVVEPRQVVQTQYIAVDGTENDQFDQVLDK